MFFFSFYFSPSIESFRNETCLNFRSGWCDVLLLSPHHIQCALFFYSESVSHSQKPEPKSKSGIWYRFVFFFLLLLLFLRGIQQTKTPKERKNCHQMNINDVCALCILSNPHSKLHTRFNATIFFFGFFFVDFWCYSLGWFFPTYYEPLLALSFVLIWPIRNSKSPHEFIWNKMFTFLHFQWACGF